MEEALAKAVSHIVLETVILAIKDECKMCMTEEDSNLPAFNSDARVDHYWGSIFEIKTVCKNSKHIKLLLLVKSFLTFQNGKSMVERSLSDNSNCVTSEKVTLLLDTKVSLRRLKNML